jgi:uncharacterized cofD-like protein
MWRWLLPGLHVKRWIGLAALGLMATGFGLGWLIWGGRLLLWPIAVAVAGGGLVAWGGTKLWRSLGRAVNVPHNALADWLIARQRAARGPRVVALGGGTGLPALLRGLKEYTSNITAIVTMADDGGSSGRLRGSLGMLPPGDIRNCLVALADAEPLMRDLFQYRFSEGELSGHSFGNLFIAAMERATGDFVTALGELSRVLAVRGAVYPVTLDPVRLAAELDDGTVVRGESQVGVSHRPIRRVWLEPGDATPLVEALRALEQADLIVIGPGSLYTSVIPTLLVAPVAEAIRKSAALTVYVANVMTQPGETDGYSAYDHLEAIEAHVGYPLVDVMVVNDEPVPEPVRDRYRQQGAEVVAVGAPKRRRVTVRSAPLLAHEDVARHDPEKLAGAVLHIMLDLRADWTRRRPLESLILEQRLRQLREGDQNGVVAYARGQGRA